MAGAADGFVWFDLLTADIPRAKVFYEAVLGWRVRSRDPDYSMASLGDQDLAGLMLPPDPALPPQWLGYLAVANVEAAARRVVTAGGRLLADPLDAPGVGRIAPILDPEGAASCLVAPARSRTSWVSGPGTWYWCELLCQDPSAAAEFYRAVLGCDVRGPSGGDLLLETRGQAFAGISRVGSGPLRVGWLPYVEVGDFDPVTGLAMAKGAALLTTSEAGHAAGRFVVIEDPLGACLALLHPRA